MNKLAVVKFGVSIVVGLGTTKITGAIIKNNVADPETVIQKVTMTAAAVVIGMMVSDATKSYANSKVDYIADTVTLTRKKYDALQEEKSE